MQSMQDSKRSRLRQTSSSAAVQVVRVTVNLNGANKTFTMPLPAR